MTTIIHWNLCAEIHPDFESFHNFFVFLSIVAITNFDLTVTLAASLDFMWCALIGAIHWWGAYAWPAFEWAKLAIDTGDGYNKGEFTFQNHASSFILT